MDYKYQLGNCIFLVDSHLFHRFPKRFICYGMDCSEITTNELDEEKLESKIVELTKTVNYTIPDYIISNILNDDKNEQNIESEKEEENEGEDMVENDIENEDKIEENNENEIKKEEKDEKENMDNLMNMNNNLYEEICNKFSIKISEKNEKIIEKQPEKKMGQK